MENITNEEKATVRSIVSDFNSVFSKLGAADKNMLLKEYTKMLKSEKQKRKAEEDLLIKPIKTNLTKAEHSEFINKRKAAGYRTNAAFARDVLIDAVELKPFSSDSAKAFFKDTKVLIESVEELRDIADEEGFSKALANSLEGKIKNLLKNVGIIRYEVLNQHNSDSAYLIAKKHLSKEQLQKLLSEK